VNHTVLQVGRHWFTIDAARDLILFYAHGFLAIVAAVALALMVN